MKLPARLKRLARQLAALPADERRHVLAAAERAAATTITGEEVDERRRTRWQRLRALAVVVNLGGDALEDCERLYDN